MATKEIGLVFVEAAPVPEHCNFLLYGPPKSGKSTAAATAPAPIMWVSAEGRNALHYARKSRPAAAPRDLRGGDQRESKRAGRTARR